MIETRLFKYFLAIAREESITKAAQSLFITQSTLSKQMQELEKSLGKKLFIRGKRKIELTEEGIFFRNRAEEILDLINKTENGLRTQKEQLRGDITIACAETAIMKDISKYFSEFKEKNPEVLIHYHNGDADMVLERLDKGLADMALLLGPIQQEKYTYLNLNKKDRFGLLMSESSSLKDKQFIEESDLSTIPLIVPEQLYLRHHRLEGGEFNPDEFNIVGTYNLVSNATFLAEEGIGYVLTLDNLVNTEGRNLIFKPLNPEITVSGYILTKKFQTFSPATTAFLNFLKEKLASEKDSEDQSY